MEARYRRDVHEPRPGEIAEALPVQAVPLPGEQGGDKPPLRLIVPGRSGRLHPPRQSLGQIPQAPGVTRLHLQLPLAVQAQEDPTRGKIAALLTAQGGGALVPDRQPHPVPRLQVQQLRAAVEQGLSPQAGHLHRTPRAVVRLRRVVQKADLHPVLPARQGLGRIQTEGGEAGKPEDSRRQSARGDADHGALPAPKQGGQQQRQYRNPRRPVPPGLRQNVLAQGAPQPEGQGEDHQPPHGYLMGARRLVRPRM